MKVQQTDAPRPPALDHGAIGNGRVLALVAPTSAIEWLCLPRFDSPSVFARLLDRERGGTFRFLTERGESTGTQSYIRNTNVLVTRFAAGDDEWEVVDFAPRIPQGLSVQVPIEFVRIVRPLRGRPRLRVDFDPRPDYGRVGPGLIETTTGIEVTGGPTPLLLLTSLPVPYVLAGREWPLDGPTWFVLRHGRGDDVPTLAELQHQLDVTVEGWQRWCQTCALPLFQANRVLRSALCLKLHAYHDTGAVIAAATTSIPEAMGTPRSWDYRYCWLRDAAFVVEALRRLSHLREGEQFLRFVRDVAETGPLQPIYGIDGRLDIDEVDLPHLTGFGGNGHVRIGNAAVHQRQNDLMGEVILCLHSLLLDPRIVDGDQQLYFPLIERLVTQAIEAAPTPDTGIWEYRSTLNVHTFSRAMCWVAIARGARLARHLGHDALAAQWEAVAESERQTVLTRGFNERLGCFTQALDGTNADAANLLLPTIGIIDAKDPRFVSTVRRYEELLLDRGLMMRYRSPDDFGLPTSAFTISR